eukprot:GHVR01012247.1.p1 GENE.GHVR01012247.1~~GHVR01012247.1.p1  ORF type:complete len:182 (-),score=17.25 GHVR01012247.1:113-658(-)
MCDISQMNSEIAGYIQTMQDELSTLFLRGEIADAPEKCMRKSTNEASNFSRTCKGELRGKDNVKRQRPSARKEALRIENMKLRNALRSSVLCQSGELGGRIDVPPRRNIMKKRTEVASDNLNSRNEELRRKKKITSNLGKPDIEPTSVWTRMQQSGTSSLDISHTHKHTSSSLDLESLSPS